MIVLCNNFLDVQEGKTGHGRYISAILISLFVFLIIGTIFYLIALFAVRFIYPEAIDMETLMPKSGTLDLYLALSINVIWLLATWFVARFILKRSFTSLITPNEKIEWKRVFFGFGLFFGLMFVTLGTDFLLNQEDYSYNIFSWKEFIWVIFAVFVLVPIQTTSEEVFFRGLLLQWLAKFTKRPIILSLIIGLIFGVLHFGNPEMSYGWIVGLDYIFVGFMWTLITIRTNSLELSIGAHAANNMFLFLFLATEESVSGKIPSLFILNEVNPYTIVMWSAINLILFFVITVYYHKKNKVQAVDSIKPNDIAL